MRLEKPPGMRILSLKGFTLAELLIALAILGVIATFTIPKIIMTQQSSSNTAKVKEAASAVSAAFQTLQYQNQLSATTQPSNLMPFLNSVTTLTSGETIDARQTGTTYDCTALNPCIKIHSGAIIRLGSKQFTSTNPVNTISFGVDPDGVVTDGTTNGPGKTVIFYLYYNGRLATAGTVTPGTLYDGAPLTADSSLDPPWFQW